MLPVPNEGTSGGPRERIELCVLVTATIDADTIELGLATVTDVETVGLLRETAGGGNIGEKLELGLNVGTELESVWLLCDSMEIDSSEAVLKDDSEDGTTVIWLGEELLAKSDDGLLRDEVLWTEEVRKAGTDTGLLGAVA